MNSKLSTQTSTKLSTRLSRPAAAGGILMAGLLVGIYLSQQGGGGIMPGFAFRQPVLIDTTFFAPNEDLYDFPMVVEFSLEALRHSKKGGKVQDPNGADIRFSKADGGSPLLYEILSYQPKSGHLVARINVDTLFHDRPNGFFLYYDNPDLFGGMVLPERFVWEGALNKDPEVNQQKIASYSESWMALERRNLDEMAGLLLLGEEEEIRRLDPLQLAYFQADVKGGESILVAWASSEENGIASYTLERSADGWHFAPIGKMGGGKYSHDELRYTYSDPDALTGKSHYRLRQTESSGTFSYSHTVGLDYDPNLKGLEMIKVRPEFFDDAFAVSFHAFPQDSIEFIIYSAFGEVVYESMVVSQGGTNQYVVEGLENWEKGVYVVSLIGKEQKLVTQTVIKE